LGGSSPLSFGPSLRGEIAAEAFRGKIVLIGTTSPLATVVVEFTRLGGRFPSRQA